jgi:biopolymer transport protein TolR
MLVLLIVFMVSAPLLQQGVDVNLPKADAGNLSQSEEPEILTIKANQSLEFEGQALSSAQLSERLAALANAKPTIQILVQADQSVSYGMVAKIMAKIKKANINRVGLVTAPENSN